eukprot:scaffold9032_cov75-Skeletonema_marinoi.AAC.1
MATGMERMSLTMTSQRLMVESLLLELRRNPPATLSLKLVKGYGSVSSAEECGDMCSMCPGNDQGGLVLRGFMYYGQCNDCECLVDFDSNGFDKTVCEGAYFAYDANEGSGEIVNTTPSPTVQCWKVSSPS